MGKRGPPPLPAELRESRGTLQPCRTNPDRPRITPTVPPTPPGLLAAEKRRFSAWAELLVEMGVLNVTDGAALGELVRAETRVGKAHRAFRKSGATEVVTTAAGRKSTRRTAAAQELDSALADLRRWLAAFGCTPADRSRVSASKPKAPAKNPAEEARRAQFRHVS